MLFRHRALGPSFFAGIKCSLLLSTLHVESGVRRKLEGALHGRKVLWRNKIVSVLKEKVLKLILPELEAMGIDLVELEISGNAGKTLLRLYIDRLGETKDRCTVSIADCETASRAVERLLDVEDLFGRNYVLEVSTPGVERVLRNAAEFTRFKGRLANVNLKTEGPNSNFSGRIKDVNDDVIMFDMNGRDVKVNVNDIRKAKLKIER